MLGRRGPGADLVGALGHAAHVEAGLVGARLPVVQRGLEVVGEAQTQPHEAALGHQRARRAGADAGAVQRHHHGAARLALAAPRAPRAPRAAPQPPARLPRTRILLYLTDTLKPVYVSYFGNK